MASPTAISRRGTGGWREFQRARFLGDFEIQHDVGKFRHRGRGAGRDRNDPRSAFPDEAEEIVEFVGFATLANPTITPGVDRADIAVQRLTRLEKNGLGSSAPESCGDLVRR